MRTSLRTISSVAIFAIAMGFMEAAVVIYLRAIYYKDGFGFPLRPMDHSMALVEIIREAATVVMLICTGCLAGKTKLQRFAYFSLAFAVWDLFYYVFLYLFLGWPQSLATWDILFLIPLPWIGPVWAPCLLCLLMIAGSAFVIVQTDKCPSYTIKRRHWALLITGSSVCILAFLWDYIQFCTGSVITSLFSQGSLFMNLRSYVPRSFNHPLFFAGCALMSYPVILNIYITLKTTSHENK